MENIDSKQTHSAAKPRRFLIVYYSQSGQTRRAADLFQEILSREGVVDIATLDIGLDPAVRGGYPMPWTFFDFLRAQPVSFGAEQALSAHSDIDPSGFDILVILYPIWFLTPAAPMGAWLRRLPAGSLRGKDVVTVCTARNMWASAQRIVRAAVEKRGGRVVAHAALEDRAPESATLVTTPRFFLTGKKSFDDPRKQRKYPPFGIRDVEYVALGKFATNVARWDGVSQIRCFHMVERRVLSDIVGRRISRIYCLLWPLFRNLPKIFGNIYMGAVAILTLLSMFILMPPAALACKMPGLSRALKDHSVKMLSAHRGDIITIPIGEGSQLVEE